MTKYKLILDEKAKKDLRKIDKYQAKLITNWIFAHIDNCENPRVHGKPLKGPMGHLWSYRVGNYRIICEIKDNELIVLAINIGHRKQIYN